MKKWILCGVAIAVLSTVAFFAAASKQTPELSPTQLANIEALAKDEGGMGGLTITAKCEIFSVVERIKYAVICPRCYTIWTPASNPKGRTDISTISGKCTCGQSFI